MCGGGGSRAAFRRIGQQPLPGRVDGHGLALIGHGSRCAPERCQVATTQTERWVPAHTPVDRLVTASVSTLRTGHFATSIERKSWSWPTHSTHFGASTSSAARKSLSRPTHSTHRSSSVVPAARSGPLWTARAVRSVEITEPQRSQEWVVVVTGQSLEYS